MPLFREGGLVEDPWQKLDDDAPVPADGMVLVSFARWLSGAVGPVMVV